MAGTVEPSGRLRVKLEELIVAGSIAREKVARTVVAGSTPVAALAGVFWVTVGGELLSSSTMSDAGHSGVAPMSRRMFVVACWILRSGSPTPSALIPRPRFHWFVPVSTTSEPLGHCFFTMWATAVPGA